jgi:hypothetical protein
MKKALLVFMLGLLVFGALMQIDDNLNPKAQQWLDRFYAKPTAKSPAFDYLSKIDKQDGEKLKLPSGDLFCTLKTREDCYAYLYQHRSEWPKALKDNALLLSRYQHFMEMDQFHNPNQPQVESPVPPFTYLSRGQRLSHLTLWLVAEQGQPEAALKALAAQEPALRRRLANADTLLYKMWAASMLSENLNMQGLLAIGYHLPLPQAIAPLNQKERSLRMPVLREFAREALVYRKMDRSESFFEKDGKANGWWVRALFKPNMVLNASFQIWQKVVALSEMLPQEYFKKAPEWEAQADKESNKSQWRNYVGSAVVQITRPNYRFYVQRYFDLNLKIRLLNHLTEVKQGLSSHQFHQQGLKNPEDGQYPALMHEGTGLCYLPVSGEAFQCLPLTFLSAQG